MWFSNISIQNLIVYHVALITCDNYLTHWLLHWPKPAVMEPQTFSHLWCNPFFDRRCLLWLTQAEGRNLLKRQCPNKRDLGNWARLTREKPIRFDWQNQRKIWSCYHLPLLVKKLHLLQRFLGNFYSINKV